MENRKNDCNSCALKINNKNRGKPGLSYRYDKFENVATIKKNKFYKLSFI